jgi:predicted alpha/beta-fold hydrolase
MLRNGHAQTLAGSAWPRRSGVRAADESRLFEVEPGVRILAHCWWHEDRTSRGTLVLVHGLGGSAESPYVLGAARLAFGAGFNVVRINQRNCGGTEHLTPTLYHSGMSGDVASVVRELADRDGLERILVGGFSMGGNLALKMAGEFGEDSPPELVGVCAVSPALDLTSTVEALEKPSNTIYQSLFVRGLKNLALRKKQLYPDLYDVTGIENLRTVRDFDETYTAPHAGFVNAADYYTKCSAIRVTAKVRTPTLIIHAQDDPFVPYAPLLRPEVSSNPNITAEMPPHGGHVAFVSSNSKARFWAEHRLASYAQTLLKH